MRLMPLARYTLSSTPIADGLAGTWQTIAVMRRLVREGSRDPMIRDAALRIIWLQPAKNQRFEVEAIFDHVRAAIRYVRDPVMFECVSAPRQVLALGYGDCDDKSVLLAALLESVGYPTRFVIAGYQRPMPEHVYVQVLIDGEWIDADATEYGPLGYAPPNPLYLEYERV